MNEEKLSPVHPGEILLEEFLMPMNITREKLAGHISISEQSVSDIISGRSPITVGIALRLGIFFGMSPIFWLDLQTDYDLDTAEDELEEQLSREVLPYAA